MKEKTLETAVLASIAVAGVVTVEKAFGVESPASALFIGYLGIRGYIALIKEAIRGHIENLDEYVYQRDLNTKQIVRVAEEYLGTRKR